jgi:hypothetical protein
LATASLEVLRAYSFKVRYLLAWALHDVQPFLEELEVLASDGGTERRLHQVVAPY